MRSRCRFLIIFYFALVSVSQVSSLMYFIMCNILSTLRVRSSRQPSQAAERRLDVNSASFAGDELHCARGIARYHFEGSEREVSRQQNHRQEHCASVGTTAYGSAILHRHRGWREAASQGIQESRLPVLLRLQGLSKLQRPFEPHDQRLRYMTFLEIFERTNFLLSHVFNCKN